VKLRSFPVKSRFWLSAQFPAKVTTSDHSLEKHRLDLAENLAGAMLNESYGFDPDANPVSAAILVR
jgi:hypothetical protein